MNENEEKYRAVLEQSIDNIFIMDIESRRLTDFNLALQVLLGYNQDEMNELTIYDIVAHSRESIDEKINLLLRDGSFNLKHRQYKHKNGSIIDVEVSGALIRFAGKKAICVVSRDISGRTKYEKKLLETQKQMRLFIDSSPDMVFLKDEDFRYLMINKKNCEFFGKSEEEIIGKTDFDLMPEDVAKGCYETDKQAIVQKELIVSLEKVGDKIFESRKTPLIFDNRVHGVTGIIRDVTEDIYKEKALKESEEKFRMIIEHAVDILWRMDLDFNFTYISSATEIIFGYSADERLKMDLANVYSEESIQKLKNIFYIYLEDFKKGADPGRSAILELEGKHRNGTKLWLEVNAKFIVENNDVVGIQGVTRDITQRRIYELENRKVQDSLIRAEKIASIGNWEFDLESGIVNASLGARSIYGLGLENETITMSQAIAIPVSEDRHLLDEAMLALIKFGEPYDIKFKIQRKSDGEIRDIHSLAEYDKERNIVFGVIRDITDEIQKEQALIAAKEKAEQSERLKTSFLENISHEIRTPMNGIIGFSNLLKEQDLREEEKQEFTDLIINSGKRLLNIVNDVLDISTLESGHKKLAMQSLNLKTFLNELYSFFKLQAENKKIELILQDSDIIDINVITDPEILKRALSNLINNAIKFTNRGFVKFGCSRSNSDFEFFVIDTGIGISPEHQKEIFNRFVQIEPATYADNSGTGLGLPITKGCAEILGGTVSLESSPDSGSAFYFRVPLEIDKKKEEQLKKKLKPKKPDFSGITILIAEDEISNYLFLERILRKVNANFILAENGQKAVELYKEFADSIDIILMDIKMPVLNGLNATKIIKKINPDIPIIAQTAYAMPEDKRNALSAGCDDYISKPIDLRELMDKIDYFLDKQK